MVLLTVMMAAEQKPKPLSRTNDSALSAGHSAVGGVIELREHMTEEQPPVTPRGWTVLIHGTDTERWRLGEEYKTIVGYPGLSAITSEEAAADKAMAERLGNPGAYDTTASYARRNPGLKRVDVRVLFYQAQLGTSRIPNSDVADIKESLDVDTRQLISKYHQPRHAVVPKGEVLLSLGAPVEEADRFIEYFVPASVAANYVASVREGATA